MSREAAAPHAEAGGLQRSGAKSSTAVTVGTERLKPAVWALLAIGAAVRIVAYLGRGSLWTDEAGLALNLVGRDFAQIARPFIYDQYAPYLYLLESKLASQLLGTTAFALRVLSLLAGIAVLPVAAILARRVFAAGSPAPAPAADKRAGGEFAALFAVACLVPTETAVYYSTEFKPYEQDGLIAFGLCLLVAHIITSDAANERSLWLLAACGVIAPWFSLPVIFVLAAAGAALLCDAWQKKRGPRALLTLLLIGALWLGSFAVHYLTFLRAKSTGSDLQQYWTAMDGFGPFPLRSLSDVRWYVAKFFYLFRVFVTADFGLRYLAGLLWLWGMAIQYRRSPALFVLWLAPLPLLFGASAVHSYIIADRMLLFLTPMIVTPLALALATLCQLRPPRTQLVAAALAIALWLQPSVNLAMQLAKPARGPDVRVAVAHLKEHFQPGDRLFVETQVEWIYAYYARIAGFGVPFEMADGRLYDANATYRTLDALKGTPRLWALVPSLSRNAPRHATAAHWVAKAERAVTERLGQFGKQLAAIDAGNTRLYLYDLSVSSASR